MKVFIWIVVVIISVFLGHYIDYKLLEKDINWTSTIFLVLGELLMMFTVNFLY